MVKQSKFNKTFWNFPGGLIEQGETSEEACIREIKEELGLLVRIKDKVFHNEKTTAYTVEVVDGDIYLEKGLLEYAWVAEQELDKWDHVTKSILSGFKEFCSIKHLDGLLDK